MYSSKVAKWKVDRCMVYQPYFFSEVTVFFCNNKSANNAFGHGLSEQGNRSLILCYGRAWWLACMAKWHPVPGIAELASASTFPTHPTCAQMLRPSTGADCRTRRPQLNERIRKSDSRFRSHSACHLPDFTLAPPFPATARKILQVCNSQSSPLLYWMQIWS